eukprot:2826244-Prymnesium_polylepis.1
MMWIPGLWWTRPCRAASLVRVVCRAGALGRSRPRPGYGLLKPYMFVSARAGTIRYEHPGPGDPALPGRDEGAETCLPAGCSHGQGQPGGAGFQDNAF